MRVLITGAGGQLGCELQRTTPRGIEIFPASRAELDIVDGAAVDRTVAEIAPAVIINCAAYTAVDRAEAEAEKAFAVNEDGARNVARAAIHARARLIHVSTDFVFDGRSGRPYRIDDAPCPLSVYGRSKLAGERAILSTAGERALVVRTAWLYSAFGANFVKTILRLTGERDSVSVVADQVGTPTWAFLLAEVIWLLVGRPDVRGIVHWTDAGVASWYDFASAIREEGMAVGLLDSPAPVVPIATRDYPQPAPRPGFSVLDKSVIWSLLHTQPVHWRWALRRMLRELGATGPSTRVSPPSIS